MILRLWGALCEPRYAHHPIFRRILLQPRSAFRVNGRLLAGGSMLFGLMLVCGLAYAVPQNWALALVLLPFGIVLVFVPLAIGGTGHGTRLAAEISVTIRREYALEKMEVLASLPGGRLGLYWLILTAHVHRDGHLPSTNELQQQLTRLGFGLASFLLLLLYLNTWTPAASRVFFNLLAVVYPVVAIYYIDYVCATVTGAVVGALAATYHLPATGIRLVAIVAFLMVQGLALGATLGAATSMLPSVVAWLGFSPWLGRLGIAGGSVVSYYALREGMAWGLWKLLMARLGAAAGEQQVVLTG